MVNLHKAAEAALEAFDWDWSEPRNKALRERMKALRQALAQPEWVGLTDDEIYDYADKFLYQHGSNYGIRSFGKAIEAKLKEKNT